MPTGERPGFNAQELFLAIVNDFETAWDAVAVLPAATGRGNMMFSRQAMALLEWASRLCASDETGVALSDLSRTLAEIEPRYFTSLPGPCAKPAGEFRLPFLDDGDPRCSLLWMLFDLVRHGQAHQYQQITADLVDGYLVISLTGADHGITLKKVADARPPEHLGVGVFAFGVFLAVRPEVMFLDFKRGILEAKLLERQSLTFKPLTRSSEKGGLYAFGAKPFYETLRAGGHAQVAVRGLTDV